MKFETFLSICEDYEIGAILANFKGLRAISEFSDYSLGCRLSILLAYKSFIFALLFYLWKDDVLFYDKDVTEEFDFSTDCEQFEITFLN